MDEDEKGIRIEDKEERSEEATEEKQKKDSKLFLIAVLLIVGVVVGFVVWRIATPTGKITTIDDLHELNLKGKLKEDMGYVYNGFSFVFYDGLWYTQAKVGDRLLNVPMHFGPKDVEYIKVKGKINERFKRSKIYITFDPEDPSLQYVALSAAELSSLLASGFGIMPVAACTKNVTDACAKRPILDCSDKKKAIIYINQDNETVVEMKGNCIEVKGKDMELVKAVDRLMLKWLGIMP